MNLFNQLVTEAIENHPEYSALQVVVEKELLHHDILKILNQQGYLKELTFMGGTCLRACHNADRLSEDLDFTGGEYFSKDDLKGVQAVLENELQAKYGFTTTVSPPKKDNSNVSTWKIQIITRPEKKNLPTQRIHLDICSVKSYEKQFLPLLNRYGINMGTAGLVISCQSLEEIFTDKLIAFANRPNRVKYRDLWDILWLHQQGIKPNLQLIIQKIEERHLNKQSFLNTFKDRVNLLNNTTSFKDFQIELQRFLPKSLEKISNQPEFWPMMVQLLSMYYKKISSHT